MWFSPSPSVTFLRVSTNDKMIQSNVVPGVPHPPVCLNSKQFSKSLTVITLTVNLFSTLVLCLVKIIKLM